MIKRLTVGIARIIITCSVSANNKTPEYGNQQMNKLS